MKVQLKSVIVLLLVDIIFTSKPTLGTTNLTEKLKLNSHRGPSPIIFLQSKVPQPQYSRDYKGYMKQKPFIKEHSSILAEYEFGKLKPVANCHKTTFQTQKPVKVNYNYRQNMIDESNEKFRSLGNELDANHNLNLLNLLFDDSYELELESKHKALGIGFLLGMGVVGLLSILCKFILIPFGFGLFLSWMLAITTAPSPNNIIWRMP